jgi:hypothetical protein
MLLPSTPDRTAQQGRWHGSHTVDYQKRWRQLVNMNLTEDRLAELVDKAQRWQSLSNGPQQLDTRVQHERGVLAKALIGTIEDLVDEILDARLELAHARQQTPP